MKKSRKRAVYMPLLAWLLLIFVSPYASGQPSDPPTENVIADEADLLLGRMRIIHPNYEGHQYVKSYVYVFELNEYIEIANDGTFEISNLPGGRYSLKTYVPGFEPKYATVYFPEQRSVVIGIELQPVELKVITVRKAIPSYLKDIRELITSPEITSEAQPITPIPLPTPDGTVTAPSISINDVFDAFRNLFRRDKDENE